MSAPVFNSTLTDASPGAAKDLTALASSSASTCSSILTTIDSSTSSGTAPGKTTDTSMVLNGTVGPGLTLQGPQRYQAGRQHDDH